MNNVKERVKSINSLYEMVMENNASITAFAARVMSSYQIICDMCIRSEELPTKREKLNYAKSVYKQNKVFSILERNDVFKCADKFVKLKLILVRMGVFPMHRYYRLKKKMRK